MTPHQGQPDPLARYRGRKPLKPRFWFRFFVETFGWRRPDVLVAARMRGERWHTIDGLERLPADGPLILAVNHYSGRTALDTAAAVLHALGRARPDAVTSILVVVGHRKPVVTNRLQSLVAGAVYRAIAAIFARWRDHTIRIPLKNPYPEATGLRAWKHRRQPVFVFPEGRARLTFGTIRRGAGRWLHSLGLPVVPVGVWWAVDEGWSVRFGAPLRWTDRLDLRDVQLALAMAGLLPADLAPDWQDDLARWREAHQPR